MRREQAQAQQVAEPRRIGVVDRAAEPVCAGVPVARVVGFQTAVEARGAGQIDGKVGRPDLRARRQGRMNDDARKIGEQQQPSFQGGDRDRISAVQAGGDAAGHIVGYAGFVANADRAVAALDHGDGHGPLKNVLGRQIGLGQHIAAAIVEAGNPGGQIPEFREGQVGARRETRSCDQFGLLEEGRARNPQGVHADARAFRHGVGRGSGLFDPDIGSWPLRDRDGRNLLQLCAGGRRLLGVRALAGRQQRGRYQAGFQHSYLEAPPRNQGVPALTQRRART